MSGGPYGPGGVLSDFWGGEGGVPKVYSRRDPGFYAMMMRITAHQVHDKGEEGEWWGQKRVWVKELNCQVQACIPE